MTLDRESLIDLLAPTPHDRGELTQGEWLQFLADWKRSGIDDVVEVAGGSPSWRDLPVQVLINTIDRQTEGDLMASHTTNEDKSKEAKRFRQARIKQMRSCMCFWPIEVYRNGSGHHDACPAHIEYQAKRNEDSWRITSHL